MAQIIINGQLYDVVLIADPTTGLPVMIGGPSGGGAFSLGDGADVTQGAKSDAPVAWYTASGSVIGKIGLALAYLADAGSHVVTLDNNGRPTSDAWTLFGTTRIKTYTYPNATSMTESDWV